VVCAESVLWDNKVPQRKNLVAQRVVGAGAGVILDAGGDYGGVDLSGEKRNKIKEIVIDKYKPILAKIQVPNSKSQTKISPAASRIIDSCWVLLILFV
jgi:hypothetical protein